MDERDEAIIKILERSAKLSSRAIAKRVGLPISTVHRRIKRMEERGLISGYKALINYEKTKRPISALVNLNLAEVIPGKGHIPKKDIIKTLMRCPEIGEIIEVQAASYDLIVKARLTGLKELSAFAETLRSIEGIEEVSVAIITEEIVPPQRAEVRVRARNGLFRQ